MSKNNQNVPSAVGTNRTYGQVILENLKNGWDAIKSNTYVNMFIPLEDAAEGNTLAVVTSAVPGKQAVTTAGKAILGNVDEVVKPARKVIKPGAKKAGDFIEDGIEYTAYGSSQPGTPLYFPVPKSEVTRGKPQWIPTFEEVAEALAKHITTAKQVVSEGTKRAVDKAANYRATIQKMDRKLSRKKDPSDAKRSMYQTKARTGQLVKSDKPKVTEYLEEELAANFSPSKQAIKKNNFDRARQEWMDYLDELGYDIVTKESVKAADNIALNTWGKRFSIQKNGGSINYIQYFS